MPSLRDLVRRAMESPTRSAPGMSSRIRPAGGLPRALLPIHGFAGSTACSHLGTAIMILPPSSSFFDFISGFFFLLQKTIGLANRGRGSARPGGRVNQFWAGDQDGMNWTLQGGNELIPASLLQAGSVS